MSIDLDVLEEALRVLRSAPTLGRRRALRVLLATYPQAAALLGRRL